MSTSASLSAHLSLASRFETIEVAERTLRELCDQASCSAEEQYWLVSALREALANAIRHGNRQHPDRRVLVDYCIEANRATIRVEDEGSGFDPADVPDPRQPENLLRPSGRGIFYMRQFMEQVEFSRSDTGGTVVAMTRHLQPSTRSADDEE